MEYKILNHGVDHSQYFQGAGTSRTDFKDIATGIGRSFKEALEDAAEQLAMCGWTIPAELEREINSASDEDEVSLIQNEHRPTPVFIVTHYSRSMGTNLPVDREFTTEDDALEYARELVNRMEAKGVHVSEIKPGREWEVTEPDDAAMVPDESGIISISDNQDEIKRFERYLEESELHYFASIIIK